jgi:hypothetical protein
MAVRFLTSLSMQNKSFSTHRSMSVAHVFFDAVGELQYELISTEARVRDYLLRCGEECPFRA